MSEVRQPFQHVTSSGTAPPAWSFRLYIAGRTPVSITAYNNLTEACETFLANRYDLEVVDLLLDPAKAGADSIFAIPTVLRVEPAPPIKVIGDLSDRNKLLAGLGIPARPDSGTPD